MRDSDMLSLKRHIPIFFLAFVATACAQNQFIDASSLSLPGNIFDPFSPRRLIVIKVINGYGDFEERDGTLLTKLCLKKYKGSITQEQFEKKYSTRNVRLVSGPPIEYVVHSQVDERYTVEEEYDDVVSVPSYSDGVAMNDGRTVVVKKRRAVVKGLLRNIYGQCTAFEYHF